MIEGLAPKPGLVRVTPGLAALIDPPQSEQKLEKAVVGTQAIAKPGLAGSHEIASRLLCGSRHTDLGQFAGSIKTSQLLRVTTVRLDSVAWPDRRQGGSDDHATMTHRRDLPMQLVTARARLV